MGFDITTDEVVCRFWLIVQGGLLVLERVQVKSDLRACGGSPFNTNENHLHLKTDWDTVH